MMLVRPPTSSATAVQIWVVRALIGMAACFVASFGLSLLDTHDAEADAPPLLGAVTDGLNDATGGILEPVTEAIVPSDDPGGEAPGATPADPVGALLEPVTEAVAPVVEPVTEAVAPVTDPIVEAAAPVVEAVVAPIVETAAPVVEAVVAPVVETAAPVVGAVVQPVVAAAQPIIDGIAPVTAGIAPVVDALVPTPGSAGPAGGAAASPRDPSPTDASPTVPGGTDAGHDDGPTDPDAGVIEVPTPVSAGPPPESAPAADRPVVIPAVDQPGGSATAAALADRIEPASSPLDGSFVGPAGAAPKGSPPTRVDAVAPLRPPAPAAVGAPAADPTSSGDANASRRSNSSPLAEPSPPYAATLYGATPGADATGSSIPVLAVVPTAPATGGTGASRFDALPFGWHATTVLAVLERPG